MDFKKRTERNDIPSLTNLFMDRRKSEKTIGVEARERLGSKHG